MAIPSSVAIKFSCGHQETKDLDHIPAGKRKSYAYGLGKNFVCSRCFKKKGTEELQKQNREELIQAAAFDEEHNLPEFDGSEKQVNWATRVRYQVLTDIIDSDENPDDQKAAEATIDQARQITAPGWWLDNCTDKNLTVDDLIELITTAVDSGETVEQITTENPF